LTRPDESGGSTARAAGVRLASAVPHPSRRAFLAGALAAPAASRAEPEEQTFIAGLVASAPRSNSGAPASSVENYWRSCDDCSRLAVRHIEVNNTFAQIVQAYDSRVGEFQDEMAKRKLRLVGLAMYAHSHDPAKRRETVDEHVRVGRFLKAVGARYINTLIAPGPNLGNGDEESYRKVDVKIVASALNEAGKRVKEETGIDVAYHAEQGDLREHIWDRLLEATDPRYLKLCADVGHFASRGVDPMAVYKKYNSRMVVTHLRDFAPSPEAGGAERVRFVPFGQGVIPLPALVAYLRDVKFKGCAMGEGGGGNQAMREYMAGELHLQL